MAYDELDPVGDIRGDLHAAQIAQTIANTMGRSKGQPAFKLEEFLLPFGKPEKPKQTAAQQWKMLNVIAHGYASDVEARPDTTPPDVDQQMSKLPPEIKAQVDRAMKRM